MARIVLILFLSVPLTLIAYQTFSIGSSNTEVESVESTSIQLGSTEIDTSGLGGNNQYGQLSSSLQAESEVAAESLSISDKPLNYPNPFQLKTGTTIGYKLTQDSDIKIEIYNSFGHKILTKNISAGSDGGTASQYNRVPITYEDFDYDLAAGAYFYTIIANNQLLGKGRMAIIP
jgi:hypothetical protein